jgi:hypothetical protein
MAVTEYRLISASNAAEFQKELTSVTADKWKPILLTSSSSPGFINICAILERTRSV